MISIHCAKYQISLDSCKRCVTNASQGCDTPIAFEYPIVIPQEEIEDVKKQTQEGLRELYKVFDI